MKINTSGSKRLYEPANRCIYCDRRGVTLTKEHIIPFGLGGNWVLPKASCSKCQSIINKFEHPLQRGHFYPARVHLGFPSQHKDPRPEAFPVRFIDDQSVATVSLSDHPCVFNLLKFVEEPKILTGSEVSGKIEAGFWVYTFQPDLNVRVGKFSGRPVEPSAKMNGGQFVRLLAKIGYAFAAAELGQDGFTPLVRELILGEMATMDLLVGGLRDRLQPKDDFHDLWLSSYQTKQATYLIANVQLFASLQGPIYRVVVGNLPPGSTGLGPRAQGLPQ